MFKRNAMGNTRTKIVAGAVLMALGLSVAGSAMSANVFGGGATLPAGAYVGFDFNSVGAKLSSTNAAVNNINPTGLPTAGVAGNSLFGAWAAANSANNLSYCQTGSGGGKKIFDNTDGVNPLNATDFCTGTVPGGFGAGLTTLVNPHFAGSDAPMSLQEYGWFFTPGNKTANSQPVQFPAVVGSVAIVVHNSAVAAPVTLTDAQVCGVFSGQFTKWSQLGLPADASGDNFSVVYRSDGSGTTFSLSNHLTAVCGGTSTAHFNADQTFTTVDKVFFPGGLPTTTLPPTSANFIGANGNPAVISTLGSTASSIGYAEAANLKDFTTRNPGSGLNYAKIKATATATAFDPFSDLPASVSFLAVVTDRGITGFSATDGKPTTGPLSPISTAGCMNLIEPSTYANSTTRYPIIAVSYLIANKAGNSTDLAAVQGLIGSAYNHPAGVTTIGAGTGFAFATVPAAVQNKVTGANGATQCISI